jgi:phosphoglucomutase
MRLSLTRRWRRSAWCSALQATGALPSTPAISHAILTYNRGRSSSLADGIVITPSHNPPRDGGYKYNPPNGGPADQEITDGIEAAIAEHYKVDLTEVSETVDSRFAFMTLDWDGQIRMDPSSAYAMQRLISIKDRFHIAFACDTDHDRHGIAPIGGIKVSSKSGWFAARPSGTEDIYKIYAESFSGQEQLRQILKEAQAAVDGVIRQP